MTRSRQTARSRASSGCHAAQPTAPPSLCCAGGSPCCCSPGCCPAWPPPRNIPRHGSAAPAWSDLRCAGRVGLVPQVPQREGGRQAGDAAVPGPGPGGGEPRHHQPHPDRQQPRQHLPGATSITYESKIEICWACSVLKCESFGPGVRVHHPAARPHPGVGAETARPGCRHRPRPTRPESVADP